MFDMPEDEREALISEFLVESRPYVGNLKNYLSMFKSACMAGNEVSAKHVTGVISALHAIQGVASFLGFEKIGTLTRAMEYLVEWVSRASDDMFSEPLFQLLSDAHCCLEEIFGALQSNREESPDIADIVARIETVCNCSFSEETESRNEGQSDEDGEIEINKFMAAFIDDTEVNIEVFNTHLLNLEEGPDNQELLNELFRIAHTIKGSAGLVGQGEIAFLAHKMEDIMYILRKYHLLAREDVIAGLFLGIDKVKEILTALVSGSPFPANQEDVLSRLKQVYTGLMDYVSKEIDRDNEQKKNKANAGEKEDALSYESFSIQGMSQTQRQVLREAICADRSIFLLDFDILPVIQDRELKQLVVEEKLKRYGMVVSSYCCHDTSALESMHVTVLFASHSNEKEIRGYIALDGVADIEISREDQHSLLALLEDDEANLSDKQQSTIEIEEKPLDTVPLASEQQEIKNDTVPKELSTIRIDIRKLDALMNLTGELVILRSRFSQLGPIFGANVQIEKEILTGIDCMNTYVKDIQGNMAVLERDGGQEDIRRIYCEKLTKSMAVLGDEIDYIGEKSVALAQLHAVHELDEVTSDLGKIAGDIQNGVMQVRMVPIEGVFRRFRRVVRDLSKALAKPVVLELIGEDTELDKKLIDTLGDPLMHMVRNAVDHGIEGKEERQRANKPAQASVSLSASHDGNNICISVKDDGRGLDVESMVSRAVEEGLITQEQAQTLSDKEKQEIVFFPGFSTAKEVTGLSGRGVGMDVVKKMVENANGIIEIDSERGKGTVFTIKIPLTLAIIQALLVRVGDRYFAFPLESVVEIVQLADDALYSIDSNAVMNLRHQVLSLLHLQDVLEIKNEKVEPEEKTQRKQHVVIITDGVRQMGVKVDKLVGEEEIVIKSLSEHFSNVRGISGASILGDGTISLILDATAIIRKASV